VPSEAPSRDRLPLPLQLLATTACRAAAIAVNIVPASFSGRLTRAAILMQNGGKFSGDVQMHIAD